MRGQCIKTVDFHSFKISFQHKLLILEKGQTPHNYNLKELHFSTLRVKLFYEVNATFKVNSMYIEGKNLKIPKSTVAINVEYKTSFPDRLYPCVKEVQHQYQYKMLRQLSRLCIVSKKKQVAPLKTPPPVM